MITFEEIHGLDDREEYAAFAKMAHDKALALETIRQALYNLRSIELPISRGLGDSRHASVIAMSVIAIENSLKTLGDYNGNE